MKQYTVALLCLLLSGAGYAAQLKLPDRPYPYVTVDQDLRSALRTFGANVGLNVQVSQGVRGKVRGRLPKLSQMEFLEFLAQSFGLIWYYDGFVLYVYSSQEMSSSVLRLEGSSASELERSLKDLDIFDSRYKIKRNRANNVVYLSGPPRYLELVRATASTISREEGEAVEIIMGAPPTRINDQGTIRNTNPASDMAESFDMKPQRSNQP